MLCMTTGIAQYENFYRPELSIVRRAVFILQYWHVAQQVERLTVNQVVAGSIPVVPVNPCGTGTRKDTNYNERNNMLMDNDFSRFSFGW